MQRLLWALALLFLLVDTVSAATVVVYPNYATVAELNLLYSGYRLDVPATSLEAVNVQDRHIAYVITPLIFPSISGGYTLKLSAEDIDTGSHISFAIIDSDIRVISSLIAKDGYVTVGYYRSRPPFSAYKIYSYNLSPITGSVYCAVRQDPVEINGIPGPEAYIRCSTEQQEEKNGTALSVAVLPIKQGNTTKYMVFGTMWYKYTDPILGDVYDIYFGAAETTDPTDVLIKVTRYYTSQKAIPLFIKIPKDNPKAVVFTVGDTAVGRKFVNMLFRLGTSYQLADPLDPTKTYYNIALDFVTSCEDDENIDIFGYDTLQVIGNTIYMLCENNLIIVSATTTDTVDVVQAITNEGYTPVFGYPFSTTSHPASASSSKHETTYLLAVPAIDSTSNYVYLLYAYNRYDGKLRLLRVLSIDPEAREYSLKSYGDTIYAAYVDKNRYRSGFKKLTNFWVYVEPPYFSEAPGNVAYGSVWSTIPATLTEVNAPQYITVTTPTSIDNNKQQIEFFIDANAPQDEYGIIKITYTANTVDSIPVTFTTGVIYKTTQANDPPTTPEITDVKIDVGFATVTWKPSTDPENDPITYVVTVFDETTSTTVFEQNTTDTSVTFGIELGHVYTVSVTATDGQLYSGTATTTFTYEWYASSLIIDPMPGTYTDQNVTVRVQYTTNANATLYILTSTDGSIWSTADSVPVAGSGTYTTIIQLQPGTNYILAKLVSAVGEVTSQMVTVYYDTNIPHIIQMIEPVDGSEYQAPIDGEVSITFSAYFDTSTDTGTRTYSIVVKDDNGNTITVATISTDQPTYTLTGIYGLPEGNYIAYPVYTNPFGSDIIGTPVSFRVIETNLPNNPPSTPIPIDVQSTTDTNVWLTWRASTDPEGQDINYHLIVATDEMFRNVVIDTFTADTSYYATGLYGGYVYYWKVQACDSTGLCSPWSRISSFAIYESTAVEIIEPADGASFVTDETNTIIITVTANVFTNTDRNFEVNLSYDGTVFYSNTFTGMFDETIEQNITLTPGDYNITVSMLDTELNELFVHTVTIHVYAYGTQQAPIITLKDPIDGYFEYVTDTSPTTTITTRASFELAKTGTHTIAIEYKLRWATAWNVAISQDVNVTDTNKFSLTSNVTLGEGVWLFRAKVVDPDGLSWYSETHTVVIQKQIAPPPPEENRPGGGGGGIGAPILVPESVEWNVGSGDVVVRTITVENVGTTPIKVKISYEGEIANLIVAPPPDSPIVIPPGEYNIAFKIDASGYNVGDKVTGKIILAPTGTTIEIPVTVNITQPTGEGIDVSKLILPILLITGLIIVYYLFTAGVI